MTNFNFATRISAGLCAALCLAGLPAFAQESSLIETSTVIGQNFGVPTGTGEIDTDVGEVDIVVETALFFKNLELIGFDQLDGQTYFGILAPIRARYQATERVSFEIGAVLGQNFGDDNGLDVIEPLVRIAVQPARDVHIIAGTLMPTHATHQAVFDDTNKFQDLAEQGFQFRVDKTAFKQDSWINWRVREGDVRAEEFEIGNVSQIRLFDDIVRLDGQLLYSHAGGQISQSRRVDDYFTGLIGGSVGTGERLAWDTVKDVRVSAAALFSQESFKDAPSSSGDGYEVGAHVDFGLGRRGNTLLRVGGSYFSGDGLDPEVGDPLYRFDEYAQLGAAAVWNFAPNMNIEVGGVYQRSDGLSANGLDSADGLDNWTANINFTYGSAFVTSFLKPRRR